jgi:hypothetical protein
MSQNHFKSIDDMEKLAEKLSIKKLESIYLQSLPYFTEKQKLEGELIIQ